MANFSESDTHPTEPDAREPTETVQPSVPAQAGGPAEPAELAQTPELTETSASAETPEPAELAAPAEATEPTEATESNETTAPGESVESAETTALAGATEPDGTAELAGTVGPARPAKVHSRRTVVLLASAVGLLLVLSTLLAVGYTRTRSDLDASRRATAARAAELDAATKHQAELTSELTQTKAKLLDPVGYERIKKCVREYAQQERAMRKIMDQIRKATLTHPSGDATLFFDGGPVLSIGAAPTVCTDAEPDLK